MRVYIIAGEDSGDLHGANLIRAMRQEGEDLQVRGVGGEKLSGVGTELVAHIRDINFMGFWEVVSNLRTIRRLFRTVKRDILSWKPDVVILIDYPGFNLRMARFIHEQDIRVIYYISPQVWAWKKGRVKIIRDYVDKMLVILPFEKEFYKDEGVDVDFVGHPLLDALDDQHIPADKEPEVIVIALLPGSRKQEIKRMLPIMLDLIDEFPRWQFIIAGAPSQDRAFYEPLIHGRKVELWMNRTYELLRKADVAIVTSGTATLETALLEVPQMVVYQGSLISYWIGKRLVKVPYISLVNLILDKLAVEELIQQDFNTQHLKTSLNQLMQPKRLEQIRQDYQLLKEKLGKNGASQRAARKIFAYLREN